jgi:AraC-like DNA-binding protein
MHTSRMTLSIRSYAGRESVHAHEFHQVVLPVLGAMDLRVGDATGRLDSGHGVVVVGGSPHAGRVLGENRFVVFDVPSKGLLPDGIVARAAAAPFFAIDEPLDHLARYVSSESATGELAAAAAHHAMALLAHAIGRQISGRGRNTGPIQQVLEIIDARYAEPLTAAALARSAGMGVSRFHERFRRETGHTPADWLAAIRLDRASDLLRDTSLPIAEVALAVGFSDQSALTRSFRRRRGTTPAIFRRASATSSGGARRAD